MQTTERSSPLDTGADDRSDRAALCRVTGIAGIVTVVVLMGASFADGYENTTMTERAPAILSFFRSLDDRMGWLMSYATTLGLIACLWFAIGLALVLRPYERGVPWRSAFLAGSGIITVVAGQIASWDAAVFRSSSIDPQVARYAYDLGGLSFANSWVATGAVGICTALVLLQVPSLSRGLRWVAWWGLIAGVGEVLARAWFRHGFAYAPFALFWAWVVVLSALLLAGRFVSVPDR